MGLRWGGDPHLWGWGGAGTPSVGLRGGRAPIYGAELSLTTNLWGRAAIYGAELMLRTNLWGRAAMYGVEQMLSIDLWGRAPIYGADVEPRPMGQNGAAPPPPSPNCGGFAAAALQHFQIKASPPRPSGTALPHSAAP